MKTEIIRKIHINKKYIFSEGIRLLGGAPGRPKIGTFCQTLHVLDLEPMFPQDFAMILHHSVWKTSKVVFET